MTVRIWPVLTGIEMKSSKSIAFNTKVARAGSGKKRTCTNQILPLWTISVKFVHLTAANSKEIIGFVSLLRGAHEPFFWKDPEDCQEVGIQLPKNTDGTYQCIMKMGPYVEPVEKVVNLKVYIDGTQQATSAYTVANGAIHFNNAPASGAVVTADYEYYWKVQLKNDGIQMDHIITNLKRTNTLKLEIWR